jgi:hypothetical protein
MFISYKYKQYLSFENNKLSWQYEIIDSELGTVSGSGVAVSNPYFDGTGVIVAVIQEYGKRNLNVPANLAVAFNWYCKKCPIWSIQDIVDYNKTYNPPFPQYEKDVQKYLLLL